MNIIYKSIWQVQFMDRVRRLIGLENMERSGIKMYDGSGVGVAILDTGLCLDNEDVGGRVAAFFDFINDRETCYDDNGHGTHIAGIIGGDGRNSGGKYRGIAPKCHFIIGKVLDENGKGSVEDVKNAVDWVIGEKKRLNIRILNISIGMFPDAKTKEQFELLETVEKAWDAGLVVVVAAGNNGPEQMSITNPGISPKVITVGAIRERRVQRYYSGIGPTKECIMKPEILAPGQKIVSCKNDFGSYTIKSGSSMATPVVSGVIALLLQKEPWLEPIDVKIRLYERAQDMGLNKKLQGWGTINVLKLLG